MQAPMHANLGLCSLFHFICMRNTESTACISVCVKKRENSCVKVEESRGQVQQQRDVQVNGVMHVVHHCQGTHESRLLFAGFRSPKAVSTAW